MTTKLEELNGKIQQKSRELKDIFEKYPDYSMDVKTVEDIQARNNELTDLGKQRDQITQLEQIAIKSRQNLEEIDEPEVISLKTKGRRSEGREGRGEHEKSLGQQFVESKAFKEFKNGNGPADDFDVPGLEEKALFDTSTGFAPQAIRTGVVIDYATQMPMVQDLIPGGVTDQNAIKYMEETTFTNGATEISEGDASPESALAFTEKLSDVRKISTFIPITEETVEDVPGIQSIINNRLGLMCALRKETQFIAGNGSAPNLRGLLNIVGSQTQAKGGDSVPDAIYKAMTAILTGTFLAASGIVMHPNDWQDIRLMRTTDGIYIWGNPSEAGPERIWSLPVVKTTSMTENTALVAAFNTAMQWFQKRRLTIQMSNGYSDYFVKGKLAIRADERVALVVYRPAAICKVTGI